MSFTVAIIGRPNVGKSTLFNRLVGRRVAIVDDTPGVTRDRREGKAELADLQFTVIDTAGLDDDDAKTLQGRMREQTERALDSADIALFVIDARAGVTPIDNYFATWLRRHGVPVILIANKCEGRIGEAGLTEAHGLGFGEPVAISAEHNLGMADLFAALVPYERITDAVTDDSDGPIVDAPAVDDSARHLAIVGRPNVGKSTLVNRLLGEERMLTGPEAGITRDSISTKWLHKGRPVLLVDTAGMRRKARITDKLEGLSVGDSLRTIRFAQVVVLVMEPDATLEKQDLTIARMVIEEGRCLVIAVNKWDQVSDADAVLAKVSDRLERSFPQVRGVPVVTLSALTGEGINQLLPAVTKVYELWNKRVGTGPLNRWLRGVEQQHPPPLANGRRVRLRYLTQAKTRPPTFVVFASQPDGLPESYRRYLLNDLRATFKLNGIPIRLILRKGENPFAPKKRRG